ncbi:hypothetical protein T07_10126 [Trichinella nelsoni]|uniref:Uncharacterized protein n=1 Tax=Trichinella nelsoni TaxID=6336 RepID=A0A0V0RG60_9BILA|nr:hypothetical protein T07_10126 [Trichinella nelsoni]
MSRTATQLQRRHCSFPCVHSKLLLFFFLLLTTFTADLQQALLPATGMQRHRTACLTSSLSPSFILSHRNSTVSVSNGSPLNVDLIGFNPCASTVCFSTPDCCNYNCRTTTATLSVICYRPPHLDNNLSIHKLGVVIVGRRPAGRPTCLPACLPTAGHVTSLIVSLGNELQLAPTPASRCTLPFLFYTGDVFLVHFPSFVALCWSAEKKSTTTTSTTILSPLSNGQRP